MAMLLPVHTPLDGDVIATFGSVVSPVLPDVVIVVLLPAPEAIVGAVASL